MLYALADSLSALGRDAEAETYYRQLLRVDPTDVSAFLTYGDLLAKNVIIIPLFFKNIFYKLTNKYEIKDFCFENLKTVCFDPLNKTSNTITLIYENKKGKTFNVSN